MFHLVKQGKLSPKKLFEQYMNGRPKSGNQTFEKSEKELIIDKIK